MFKFFAALVLGWLVLGGVVSASEAPLKCDFGYNYPTVKRYLAEGRAIRAKAEAGDAQAQVELGLMFTRSSMKNLGEARRWLQRAAAQNNGRALYHLALLQRREPGRSLSVKGRANALPLFIQAFENGYWPAFGFLDPETEGIDLSPAQMARFFAKLREHAAKDDAGAMLQLSKALWFRVKTPVARAEAYELAQRGAEQKHRGSIEWLASIWIDPKFGGREVERGRKLLEKAVEDKILRNYDVAEFWRWRHKRMPNGLKETRNWFERAVAAREPCGTREYGRHLRRGNLFPKDEAYARDLYELAYSYGLPRPTSREGSGPYVIDAVQWARGCDPIATRYVFSPVGEGVLTSERVRRNWAYHLHVCQGLLFSPRARSFEGVKSKDGSRLVIWPRPFEAAVALILVEASGFALDAHVENKSLGALHRSERREARRVAELIQQSKQ